MIAYSHGWGCSQIITAVQVLQPVLPQQLALASQCNDVIYGAEYEQIEIVLLIQLINKQLNGRAAEGHELCCIDSPLQQPFDRVLANNVENSW